MIFGATGKAFSSKLLIIMLHSIANASTSKAITCRGSTLQKQMRVRNLLYKKFRRIPTNENWNNYRCRRNNVTALKRQSVKDFCFDAASVSSRCAPGLFCKKLRPLLIPNSKSSVVTSSTCILENGRIAPITSASLNEVLSLLQLITSPNLVRG